MTLHLCQTFICLCVLLLLPQAVFACEHCLGVGGANGPTIRALVFSMACLLFMIGFVGTGIGAFFLNMRHRSRMLEPGAVAVNERGDLTKSIPPNNK